MREVAKRGGTQSQAAALRRVEAGRTVLSLLPDCGVLDSTAKILAKEGTASLGQLCRYPETLWADVPKLRCGSSQTHLGRLMLCDVVDLLPGSAQASFLFFFLKKNQKPEYRQQQPPLYASCTCYNTDKCFPYNSFYSLQLVYFVTKRST